MEETRQQKLKQREERERAKFNRHLQRGGYNPTVSRTIDSIRNYEVNIQGIQFRVAKNGSKLLKVPGECLIPGSDKQFRFGGSVINLQRAGDMNAAKATPKTATIGGVRFYRSKNGNMYRSAIVKAYRYDNPFSSRHRALITTIILTIPILGEMAS